MEWEWNENEMRMKWEWNENEMKLKLKGLADVITGLNHELVTSWGRSWQFDGLFQFPRWFSPLGWNWEEEEEAQRRRPKGGDPKEEAKAEWIPLSTCLRHSATSMKLFDSYQRVNTPAPIEFLLHFPPINQSNPTRRSFPPPPEIATWNRHLKSAPEIGTWNRPHWLRARLIRLRSAAPRR